MGKLIGIDLGTTFSAAAYVNEYGKPEILPNAESGRITPSAVLFDEGTVLVGEYAVRGSVAAPDRFVSFVKRQMGKSAADFSREIDGRKHSAEELSAIILKKVKQDAEASLQAEVTDAVITVPAYFGDSQRAATANAGKIAGLNVLQLVNEPTAAAIAYGIDKLGRDQTVFVFDLGGGTFDVTLMEVSGETIRMIQTNGDPRLGGKDWDDPVALMVADRFNDEHGVDPLLSKLGAQELQLKAVEAKQMLSQRAKTRIVCQHEGASTVVELTRDQFEEMTAPKVQRCRSLCETVMRDAAMSWADIDTVLLVGGSTRMPAIQMMLGELTGKEINPRQLNPDEAVALGAALHGTLRQIKEQPHAAGDMAAAVSARYGSSDVQIIDGASHPLGTAAYDMQGVYRNNVLIEKMQPIPCKTTSDDFATRTADQRSVELIVLQGLPDGQSETDTIKFADYTIGKVVLEAPEGYATGHPPHCDLRVHAGPDARGLGPRTRRAGGEDDHQPRDPQRGPGEGRDHGSRAGDRRVTPPRVRRKPRPKKRRAGEPHDKNDPCPRTTTSRCSSWIQRLSCRFPTIKPRRWSRKLMTG